MASTHSGVSPDAAHLLPRSQHGASATRAVLVAEVAAKPTPPPIANDNSFYAFCRANWPAFVVFQTCALTGAIVSGGKGTAEAKKEAFRDAGIGIAETPSEMADTLLKMM